MTQPQIVGKSRALSASMILEAIATDLVQIRHQDKLTFADLGRVLGKSEDQAAKYCDGTAEMGVTAYAFARDQWNGRFTGTLDALIDAHPSSTISDRAKLTAVLLAGSVLAAELEGGDTLGPKKIRTIRRELESAKGAIEGLLAKLKVRAG